MMWRLNTSNPGKLKEFQRLFQHYDCELVATHFDIKEIAADPLQVIVHKSSHLGDRILVEDTSLDIEDASVGVHVKWLMEHLKELIGHKAVWTVLLAYRENNQVFVFEGTVPGTIVNATGHAEGFGFDPYFRPDGSDKTLAESKPDHYSARAKAVHALFSNNIKAILPVMEHWDGDWQNS